MIRADASRCPISAQCRMPGVPRSACYWMIEHPEAGRVDPIAGDVRAVRRDRRGCLIVCVWDHLMERKRSW